MVLLISRPSIVLLTVPPLSLPNLPTPNPSPVTCLHPCMMTFLSTLQEARALHPSGEKALPLTSRVSTFGLPVRPEPLIFACPERFSSTTFLHELNDLRPWSVRVVPARAT